MAVVNGQRVVSGTRRVPFLAPHAVNTGVTLIVGRTLVRRIWRTKVRPTMLATGDAIADEGTRRVPDTLQNGCLLGPQVYNVACCHRLRFGFRISCLEVFPMSFGDLRYAERPTGSQQRVGRTGRRPAATSGLPHQHPATPITAGRRISSGGSLCDCFGRSVVRRLGWRCGTARKSPRRTVRPSLESSSATERRSGKYCSIPTFNSVRPIADGRLDVEGDLISLLAAIYRSRVAARRSGGAVYSGLLGWLHRA